jgi:hypothetical protein
MCVKEISPAQFPSRRLTANWQPDRHMLESVFSWDALADPTGLDEGGRTGLLLTLLLFRTSNFVGILCAWPRGQKMELSSREAWNAGL